MTDAIASEIDSHQETDVHIFQVSGDVLREYEEWSAAVRICFQADKSGRLWLLIREL